MFGIQQYLKANSSKSISIESYLAPEILLEGKQQTPAVDLWSFGVILFEALTGFKPFIGQNRQEILDNIIKSSIHWPKTRKSVSQSASDLIIKILKANPKERINITQIKTHAFFEKINWTSLDPPKIALISILE